MDRRTQRPTGTRHQQSSISRSQGNAPLQHGELLEISHQSQHLPAHLQPTHLANVHEVLVVRNRDDPCEFPSALPEIGECDGYRVLQTALPPFMDKWLKPGSECLDSYPLPDIVSPSSNKLPEVGSAPGKRQRPFAGNMSQVELPRLHGSTLPMLQAPQVRLFGQEDQEEREDLVRAVRPRKLTPRTASSGDAEDLDLVAFVGAVKKLSLRSHQHTLIDMQEKNSFEEMAQFVRNLGPCEGANLLTPMRNWKAAGKLLETQMIGLLILESDYVPSPKNLDEFMGDLPRTWPCALEHLRKPCLDRHVERARSQKRLLQARSEFVRRLTERYSDRPGLHG
jgi:hypothetical protein